MPIISTPRFSNADIIVAGSIGETGTNFKKIIPLLHFSFFLNESSPKSLSKVINILECSSAILNTSVSLIPGEISDIDSMSIPSSFSFLNR